MCIDAGGIPRGYALFLHCRCAYAYDEGFGATCGPSRQHPRSYQKKIADFKDYRPLAVFR